MLPFKPPLIRIDFPWIFPGTPCPCCLLPRLLAPFRPGGRRRGRLHSGGGATGGAALGGAGTAGAQNGGAEGSQTLRT